MPAGVLLPASMAVLAHHLGSTVWTDSRAKRPKKRAICHEDQQVTPGWEIPRNVPELGLGSYHTYRLKDFARRVRLGQVIGNPQPGDLTDAFLLVVGGSNNDVNFGKTRVF